MKEALAIILLVLGAIIILIAVIEAQNWNDISSGMSFGIVVMILAKLTIQDD